MTPVSHPEWAPGLVLRQVRAPQHLSAFKLIAFDMETTLINIACIDALADATGRQEALAALAAAHLRDGAPDFKTSLRQRLAVLRGITVADLEEVYTQHLQLTPGAAELVRACQHAGLKVLLVSGGFTFFAERVKQRLALDFVRASQLEIQSGPNCGQLTGRVARQSWGDICDGPEKRRTLLDAASLLGIDAAQCIAVGGRISDLPMLGAAGLSVAFRAEPEVRAQAMVSIETGGLDRLLEVLLPAH